MRGTRSRGVVLRLVTFAGASVVAAGALAGTGGAVLAGPLPKPPGQAQAGQPRHVASRSQAQPRHGGHAAGRRHVRPRTVVRCQNDDTDQTDEIDSDSDGPSHFVSPDITAPAGRCSRDALDLAGLLAGDHRTRAGRAGVARR
jgi:hypothetical protein